MKRFGGTLWQVLLAALAACAYLVPPPTQSLSDCLIWRFCSAQLYFVLLQKYFLYIAITVSEEKKKMFILLFLASLVVAVSAVLECTSHQLQVLIGDYSSVCSSLFSDTLTLSSEMYSGLNLLNQSATKLQQIMAQVQNICVLFCQTLYVLCFRWLVLIGLLPL